MASDQDVRTALSRERYKVADQSLYTSFGKLATALSMSVPDLVTRYEVYEMEKCVACWNLLTATSSRSQY
jgi:hypothetical protein